jgi:hypothetical protein
MILDSEIIAMRRESGENLIRHELDQGFIIVSRDWIEPDWTRRTIISQDGDRIRLVALEAKIPHSGAFTRLIEKIWKRNLVPVLVEPNDLLEQWCIRHQWRARYVGRGVDRHWVFYPRRGHDGKKRDL